MNTLKERDALLEEQWKRFKKIPVNPDTEKLEKPFMDFPAGTDRLTIWKWFDERHSKGASYLMQNSQRRHTDEYMIRHWEKFRTECHFIRMDVCQCFITLVQNVSTMTQSYGEGIIRLLLKTQSGRIKTMAEKMMPYALRMTLAVLANKPDDARSISAECVTAMTKELMGVVSRYDLMDFPFMVAALRLTATSLESLLDEHGKGIADGIVANTTCITIDASELKRQTKEEE